MMICSLYSDQVFAFLTLESSNELSTAIHRPLTALNSPLNSNNVVVKSELGDVAFVSTTSSSRAICQKPSIHHQQRTFVTNKLNDNLFGNSDNCQLSNPKNRMLTSPELPGNSAIMNGSANMKSGIKLCSVQDLLKAVETVNFQSAENIQDAAMRLMTSSIRFARNLPCFVKIPFRDQIILLEESWKKLFVLDAAYWALPLEIASFLKVTTSLDDISGRYNSEIRLMQELLTHLRSFSYDLTELACLKAIIIFRPETKGLKDAETVDRIQEDIQQLLLEHVSSLHPNRPTRFGKLLLSLLPVQSLAEKPIEEFLFKVANDKDIFETLLSKLIET
ncbi:Photoreceptor-specific nuclear receptor [Exaiptasia diaphana]|nr:Photoreceptor-specific nuclear receptor [Exaiptasia diaphana]